MIIVLTDGPKPQAREPVEILRVPTPLCWVRGGCPRPSPKTTEEEELGSSRQSHLSKRFTVCRPGNATEFCFQCRKKISASKHPVNR